MKPVNLNTAPCSPVSSNCVIWQGPNIPCINLCNGDTVSDVVFALATELCGVLDTLNVANYDLTCFGITACGPNDFQALIQFLIAQICALQGITPVPDKSGSTGCPDCLVTVAPCFVVGNQTTMNLTDYVNMIAAKICSIIDQLAIINATLTSLDIRVTTLENAPDPTFTIPSYTIDCSIGTLLAGTTYPIDTILASFTNEVWCPFYTATGTTSEILAAVASECILGTDPSRANPGVDINVAYPTWDTTSNTLASTINNIWIALCDLYNASLTVADTNTVNLSYTAGLLTANVQDTDWVRLEGFSYIPDTNTQGVPMVRRIGNVLHFRGTVIVPLINGGSPLTWDYSSGVDSYFLNTTVLPFSGTGGVQINSSGNIVFNNGNPVIPLSIIPVGWTIDKNYQNPAGWKVAYRVIPIDSDNSTILTTLFSQVISSTGTLTLGMIKDIESSTISGAGGVGSRDTSHLNTIISHVQSGQLVPKYSDIGTTIYDNAIAGSQPSSIYFTAGYMYPFSCNANNQNEIGGFLQRLDGLTAFISPCADLLPTPTPCS